MFNEILRYTPPFLNSINHIAIIITYISLIICALTCIVLNYHKDNNTKPSRKTIITGVCSGLLTVVGIMICSHTYPIPESSLPEVITVDGDRVVFDNPSKIEGLHYGISGVDDTEPVTFKLEVDEYWNDYKMKDKDSRTYRLTRKEYDFLKQLDKGAR